MLGASKTFSVQATGTAPLGYQWMRGGIPIAGATASTYTFTPTYGDDGTTFTVRVTNAAGAATSTAATISVMSVEVPPPIAACRDITSPGAYKLAADLSPTETTCISVHDTHDVQLDCAGHTIARNVTTGAESLVVYGTQDVSIRNCRFEASSITLGGSTNGSFTNNTIVPSSDRPFASAGFDRSSRMTFDSNTILGGAFSQNYGDGNTVSRNHITAASAFSAGTVLSVYGTGTHISGNVLDGSSTARFTGADDGIVIEDERNAVIEDNTIQNVWDCGIEFAGVFASSTVARNRITNAAMCGIGGWYWLSVSKTTFVGNTVERSGTLFYFSHDYGLRPAGFDWDKVMPADTAVLFKDNVFEGNVLLDPVVFFGQYLPASSIPLGNNLQYVQDHLSDIPGERAVSPADFQITNNTFTANDFGHFLEAPEFVTLAPSPAGMFIDGGGNICKPSTWPYFPLLCH